MEVLGLDVFRGGWIVVGFGGPRRVTVDRFASVTEALEASPDAAAVGVDIPIGLPTAGVREADTLARRLLGPRRSSVFATPPRRILEAPDYTTARKRAESEWVQGVSAQAYRLASRILEVADLDAGKNRLFEVHPEVSFRELNGAPLPSNKKTWNGQMARRRLLAGAGIEIPDDLGRHLDRVASDDILDAAVVAWSAMRIARGEAVSLPHPPELNASGDRMAIWY